MWGKSLFYGAFVFGKHLIAIDNKHSRAASLSAIFLTQFFDFTSIFLRLAHRGYTSGYTSCIAWHFGGLSGNLPKRRLSLFKDHCSAR